MRSTKMFKSLKNVIFLLLLLKMCVIFGQENIHRKRIILDVGHGGNDSGAIAINGSKEKDVVLAIGMEMVKLNRSLFDNRFDLFLIRYDDSYIGLSERIRVSKKLKGDVFISLHGNSFFSYAKGMEIYTDHSVSEDLTSNTRTSIALGNEILKEASLKISVDIRGMKFEDFQVLRGLINFCPAILIEVGFLNNPDEAVFYTSPEGIRAIALTILSGINNYLKSDL